MYFYGTEKGMILWSFKAAINQLRHCATNTDEGFVFLLEFKTSRKSGYRYCIITGECLDCNDDCEDYEPRNNKSGICKYNYCGIVPTGRKWKVFWIGTYEKISGRKRI